ncbi:MAG: OadG family protein [Spirochaetaceae bacterium]|jgi:oxaloacetate decarboxylase gamma subunit|nr:OadG family protein [Spirochaetaceae bacterium]
MTIAEMFEQSGVFTLLGMGIVFGFLVVLIISVSLTGKIIHALWGGKDVTAPVKAGTSPNGGAGAENAAVTAAISAAVNEYRKSSL